MLIFCVKMQVYTWTCVKAFSYSCASISCRFTARQGVPRRQPHRRQA